MLRKMMLILVCMCTLFLFPIASFADSSEYTVYVGGIEMTASEDGKITYYVNGTDGNQGTVSDSEPSDWNAKLWYDTENKTLTLDMKDLDAEGIADDVSSFGAGIHSAYPITINVSGTNNIEGAVSSVSAGSSRKCSYGIYVNGLYIKGDGTLDVYSSDVSGNSYAIYSAAPAVIENTTLKAEAGDVVNIGANWDFYSSGIYAVGSFVINDGDVTTIGGAATRHSTGIYVDKSAGTTALLNDDGATSYSQSSTGESGGIINPGGGEAEVTDGSVVINGGTVVSKSGRGYASGMITAWSHAVYAENDITINDGDVTAEAGDATTNTCGIYAYNGNVIINGGSVEATGGKATANNSRGIFAERNKIIITDGNVKGTGGTASSNFSQGIGGFEGVEISGGTVEAISGLGDIASIGLYSDWDLIISGDATVTAEAKTTRIYSYGTYVWRNMHMSDNAVLDTTSGVVEEISQTRERRSMGIYFGAGYYEPNESEKVIDDLFTMTGGMLTARSADAQISCAMGFFDATEHFSDADQPDDKWYKWKINESDEMTLSKDAEYVHEGVNAESRYLHIEPASSEDPEPIYKKITFKVEGGTWADGSTEDIIVEVELEDGDGNPAENGTASLTEYIPTGMIPDEGYEKGTWDTVPPATVSGTQDEVYTYIFTKEEAPVVPPVDPEDPVDPEEPEKPDNDDAVDSGDEFNLAAMIAVMMLTTTVMTAAVTVRRRG